MTEAVAPFPWIHPVNAVALGIGLIVSLLVYFLLPSSGEKSDKKHVIITGGSSGIGLALAEGCCTAGFENVTLVARNMEKLKRAQKKLGEVFPSTKIHVHSVDIGDYQAIAEAVPDIIKKGGPPSVVFSNAGITSAHSFETTPIEDYQHLINVNYLGSVYVTRALMPHISRGATLVYTSSLAGQLGVFGYTAYSPTKYALRGFCEALQMEVRREGIRVVLAYPPDTETPGLAAENETKPKETFLISDSAGVFQPDIVAKTMIDAAISANPPFNVYFGLEGWMLSTLSAGMSPVHGLVDGLCQVFLMSLLRFVSLFYLWDFTRIIAKCGKDEKKDKKE